MPIGQPQLFPTLDQIMQLVRSMSRDTFSGVGGQQGRIFTNDSPFTLPFLNEALDWMNRALRNEGVTFPIRDNVIIYQIPPQAINEPAVNVRVGFDGYFDGQTMHGTKKLPGDLMQPLVLQQRVSGTQLPFARMSEAQEGLISSFPQQFFGQWEWINYEIRLNGSLQTMDLMFRYVSGQLPLNTLPEDFTTTIIHVQDCKSAIANKMAQLYAERNNGEPGLIAAKEKAADAAIQGMAEAYVRQQQGINRRRPSYGGGGSGQGDGADTGQMGGIGGLVQ